MGVRNFMSNSLEQDAKGLSLKLNILGLIGGAVAFISLVLPWWSITLGSAFAGPNYGSLSIYPYQATASGMGYSSGVSVNLWYGWAALVLVVVGGTLGIAGSLFAKGRIVILVGGLLAMLSIVIFAVGLQGELSQQYTGGFPQVNLFSQGVYGYGLGSITYNAYLSYGFWIAVISAIIMIAASARKAKQAPPAVPMPTSPPSSARLCGMRM
jgi:hypothetical protein